MNMKRDKDHPYRRKFTFRERFRYWFDNKMSGGSFGLIRHLIIISVVLAIIFAGVIVIFGFYEGEEAHYVFWNGIATLLNAWMPFYEDGSIGYLAMMTLISIIGVLFTSVLIGIITTYIAERIDNLKAGNSFVLERDHIVILGFLPGECTLLSQLIQAAEGKPVCIVVAEDLPKEEMERNIFENLDVPKNCRIVCRTVDITDPASIEKCSVDTCRTVIVSPVDDMKVIKAVLAVSVFLEKKDIHGIKVNAMLSREKYMIPDYVADDYNIIALQTNHVASAFIAHSCTREGLLKVFMELLDFKNSEFYLIEVPGIGGLSFEQLVMRLNGGSPIGIFRDDDIVINPSEDYCLRDTDKVVVLSETRESARLEAASDPMQSPDQMLRSDLIQSSVQNVDGIPRIIMDQEESKETAIINYNELLPAIIRELPKSITRIYLALQEITQEERDTLDKEARIRGMEMIYIEGVPTSDEVLFAIARRVEHIVILNDHSMDPEEADLEVICQLLKLIHIRKKNDFRFNITFEMFRKQNQRLVGNGSHTDHIVLSSLSSLILSQAAENPEMRGVFHELFSNEEHEICLKNVGLMHMEGEYKIRRLRQIMVRNGCIVLGYVDSHYSSSYFNDIDETVTLSSEDSLIVITKNYG